MPPPTQGGHMPRSLVLTAAAVVLACVPSVSAAAVANDTPATATPLTSLPFDTSYSLADATTERVARVERQRRQGRRGRGRVVRNCGCGYRRDAGEDDGGGGEHERAWHVASLRWWRHRRSSTRRREPAH